MCRSFGDYFKKEAVEWSFDALTEGLYGLPADRLYATYFGGDEALGLPPDLECRDLWLKFLPADRVLPGGRKDNFWEVRARGYIYSPTIDISMRRRFCPEHFWWPPIPRHQ